MSGSANASASADAGPRRRRPPLRQIKPDLFGGEITASSIVAQAHAEARPGREGGHLRVGGDGSRRASASPSQATRRNSRAGDSCTIAGGASGSPAAGYRGSVTALEIRSSRGARRLAGRDDDPRRLRGGCGAGRAAEPAVPVPRSCRQPGLEGRRSARAGAGLPAPVRQPPDVTPKLTAGGYVFPVYGPSSFIDTFGTMARRHLERLASRRRHVCSTRRAVARDCVRDHVFSGLEQGRRQSLLAPRRSGKSLLLRASLFAFSPLAVNGNKVNAGDVVGFVGNTGDAQGTPFHLHFEVHPVALLADWLRRSGQIRRPISLPGRPSRTLSFAGGDAWAPLRSLGNAPKTRAVLDGDRYLDRRRARPGLTAACGRP